jgi:DNA sulfur modification protein DndC
MSNNNNSSNVPLEDFMDPIDHESVFKKKTLSSIYEEIQKVYLGDKRPWVIGFSGGKDSTALLQLIWYAISKLDEKQLEKPIYVISSDTLVETPSIVNHIDQSLKLIAKAANNTDLPINANKVVPKITESFWVNILGRGYPAPSTEFRWCTDRMKIKPANRFIKEKISQNGEVIVVLGVRKSESMTRAQVMEYQKSRTPGNIFSSHSTIPGALVYTPIEDWSINDVWTYLLQNKNPWGSNNRDLLALYNSASGECPVVIDTTTPSCGNSRFGCWTCTVVKRDVALESMIEQGETWMEPMLEIRDFLKDTQLQSKKIETRSHIKRNGRIVKKNLKISKGERQVQEESISFGPYKFQFRLELLEMILTAQKEVQEQGDDKDFELITMDELKEIRRLWLFEEGDWVDSLPKIYQDVLNKRFPITFDDVGSFSELDLELLSQICDEKGVPLELVTRLLDIERLTFDMVSRPLIHKKIESILKRDYHSREDALLEVYGKSEEEILASLKEENL